MIGWMISILRETNPHQQHVAEDRGTGDCLAFWEADLEGLDWIKGLVEEGRAQFLGGNGYPFLYSARIADIYRFEVFSESPPFLKSWATAKVDFEMLEQCSAHEWVTVRVFDLS